MLLTAQRDKTVLGFIIKLHDMKRPFAFLYLLFLPLFLFAQDPARVDTLYFDANQNQVGRHANYSYFKVVAYPEGKDGICVYRDYHSNGEPIEEYYKYSIVDGLLVKERLVNALFPDPESVKKLPDSRTKFQLVEEKPGFMGGDANAFSKWVNEHLRMPQEAKENGIQGRVLLQFTVDENGNVRDVKVVKGVHPALDKEAVRVVSNSPRWTPGKQRGKPIPVTYTFPVIFQL